MPLDFNISQLCGWIPRPDEVNKFLSKKAKPTFQEAAPQLSNYWQGEEVRLWSATKQVNNGNHLPADKQTIGDCVSHGYARGIDYLHCMNQVSGLASGYVEGQTSAMSEAIYGCSKEVGHDLSPQDGSTGIWAIQGMLKYGYTPRNGVPYDGQKAKQYGWRGTPAELKTLGTKNLLKDYALLKTPQDMANALKAGRPCPICTVIGFTMTRDTNGVCRAQGQWGHCMLVIGLYSVGGTIIFVILQSWGQNVPNGPTPCGGDAPNNSFGCEWNTMGRILNENDSFALNGIENWEPLPPLDWVM